MVGVNKNFGGEGTEVGGHNENCKKVTKKVTNKNEGGKIYPISEKILQSPLYSKWLFPKRKTNFELIVTTKVAQKAFTQRKFALAHNLEMELQRRSVVPKKTKMNKIMFPY